MVGMGLGLIGVGCVVLVCVGWMKLNNSYYNINSSRHELVFTFEAHDMGRKK